MTKKKMTSADDRLLAERTWDCMKPLQTTRLMKAKNQRGAWRGSSKSIAPIGQINDHKITALPLTNPPSATINRKGSNKISRS